MAIYSNGLVGPCCNLVGRKTPIGNIKDNPIKEIWRALEIEGGNKKEQTF